MTANPYQPPQPEAFTKLKLSFPLAYQLTSVGVLLGWGLILLLLRHYANLTVVDGNLEMNWTWTRVGNTLDPVISTHWMYTSLLGGVVLLAILVAVSLAVANGVCYVLRRRERR